MADFDFLDVNITLDRPSVPSRRVQADAAAMKAELAALGITAGLVRHTLSAEYHPNAGNERVTKELAAIDGFEAVWAVLPQWTGEFPGGEALARAMASAGIRAVTAYPARHGWSLTPSVSGELFGTLADMKALFFLPLGEAVLAEAETIARNHPALPVILTDVSYRITRDLYAVMARRANVYLEISGYMVHDGLEDIAGRFGIERLLFGSRYPLYNPGAALAAVMYAGLSDNDKVAIAGGNTRRLLGEVRL